MRVLIVLVAALALAADANKQCTYTYTNSDCSGDPASTSCIEISGSDCASVKCFSLIAGVSGKATCSGGCFPAAATVLLEGGARRAMSELQVGDRVQVGDNEFSDVYMFSHSIPKAEAEYVSTTTEARTTVRLTASHYLYVNGGLSPAGSVVTGDKVVLANGTATGVVSVSASWSAGIYNPHTLHRDIVVDGVLTSTYTTAVHPTVAHAVLAPLRMLYAAGVTVYSAAVERALPPPNALLPASA